MKKVTATEAYNELVNYVAGNYLDRLTEEEIIALYNKIFKED